MKQNKEAKEAVDQLKDLEEKFDDPEIIPAVALGLVDTILFAMVNQPDGENEYSVLSSICEKIVQKAVMGDIDACRLLFNRISGHPVTFVAKAQQSEDEMLKEIAFS